MNRYKIFENAVLFILMLMVAPLFSMQYLGFGSQQEIPSSGQMMPYQDYIARPADELVPVETNFQPIQLPNIQLIGSTPQQEYITKLIQTDALKDVEIFIKQADSAMQYKNSLYLYTFSEDKDATVEQILQNPYQLIIWSSDNTDKSEALNFMAMYAAEYAVPILLVTLNLSFDAKQKNMLETIYNSFDKLIFQKTNLTVIDLARQATIIQTFGGGYDGTLIKNLVDIKLAHSIDNLEQKLYGAQWGAPLDYVGYTMLGTNYTFPQILARNQINIYGNFVESTLGAYYTTKSYKGTLPEIANIKIKKDGTECNMNDLHEFLFERKGYFTIRKLTDTNGLYAQGQESLPYDITINYSSNLLSSDLHAGIYPRANQKMELEITPQAQQVELFKLLNYRMHQAYYQQYAYDMNAVYAHSLTGAASKTGQIFSGALGSLFSGKPTISVSWQELPISTRPTSEILGPDEHGNMKKISEQEVETNPIFTQPIKLETIIPNDSVFAIPIETKTIQGAKWIEITEYIFDTQKEITQLILWYDEHFNDQIADFFKKYVTKTGNNTQVIHLALPATAIKDLPVLTAAVYREIKNYIDRAMTDNLSITTFAGGALTGIKNSIDLLIAKDIEPEKFSGLQWSTPAKFSYLSLAKEQNIPLVFEKLSNQLNIYSDETDVIYTDVDTIRNIKLKEKDIGENAQTLFNNNIVAFLFEHNGYFALLDVINNYYYRPNFYDNMFICWESKTKNIIPILKYKSQDQREQVEQFDEHNTISFDTIYSRKMIELLEQRHDINIFKIYSYFYGYYWEK